MMKKEKRKPVEIVGGLSILSRYCGPTNFRGSRVIVSTRYARKSFPWESELNVDENHVWAVSRFIDSLPEDSYLRRVSWNGAASVDGRGYTFAPRG